MRLCPTRLTFRKYQSRCKNTIRRRLAMLLRTSIFARGGGASTLAVHVEVGMIRLVHLLHLKWQRLITWIGGNMKSQQDIIEGSIYHYRYIDHGAQYRVYSIMTTDGVETGRVIKVPISFKESKKVLAPHL